MITHSKTVNTWRMLLVIGAVVLCAGILFAWSRALLPVLLALVIAYLAHPLASFFERRRLPRLLGFLIVLFLFFAFLFLVAVFFVPAIVHEFMDLGEKFTGWRGVLEKKSVAFLADMERRYPEGYALLKSKLTEWAEENLPSIAQRLVNGLMGLLGSVLGLAGTLLNLALVLVISAYLTVDFHRLINGLQRLVPKPVLPTVRKVVREMSQVLRDFLRGQFLVAVALAAMYTLGLVLAQAPLALVIGPIAGILGLVPYLGFAIGIGLALIFAALEHQDFWHPAGVIITFAVAQTVESWFLTPWLVGRRVGLHPVWIMVALLLGGELFGIPGIIVAVPVAAALQVVLRHMVRAYQGTSFYLGPAPEIVFYTREKCPLCQEFELMLEEELKPRKIDFQRLEVDGSSGLKERFGTRVPVVEINGEILAEGRITPAELGKRLEGALGREAALEQNRRIAHGA